MDSNIAPAPVMCEVCGTIFETRRGLSSHARLHLRQLGVTLSESSGAPIDLLYQIIQERDGNFPNSKKTPAPPVLTPPKTTPQQEPRTPPGPKEKGSSSKAVLKAMATLHKTASQGSPATSFLAPSSSPLRAVDARLGGGRSSSGPSQASTKPLWAPQETDAPLTLATNSKDEVHVCQLCGAWYETRKGLASHARAHLRQFGVTENTETKGGPIELLYQIMQAEDVSPISSKQQEPLNLYSTPKSPTKRPTALSPPPVSGGSASSESLQSPPRKRVKTSEDFTCLLCGEEFENRKGLASHSRSHLRQIGVTDLLGKASAIDAVQQLVSTGVLAGVQPLKTNTRAPSPAPSPSPSARSTQSPLSSANRAPKAKKGFHLAVDPLSRMPKPEHIEMEVSSQPQASGWSRPTAKSESVHAGSSTHMESIPHIPCEFCSQLFDSRKALSCHARAHLRQLGIAWPLNESPIDVLKDYMNQTQNVKNEGASSSISVKPVSRHTWAPQGPKRSVDSASSGGPSSKPSNTLPLNFSLKDKMPPVKSGTSQADTSCELCGFDFDNRKALASHARAHLRQLGVVEWKVEGVKGSPIKLLSEWIQREPAKVVEITRRYRMGDLYIKKTQRSEPSPSPSPSVTGGTLKSPGLPSGHSVPGVKSPGLPPGHRADRDGMGVFGGSSKAVQGRLQMERGHAQTQPSRGDLSVHSPRGFHSLQHPAPTEEENQDTNSQQPPRSGNIPALLPKPPLAPLVKMVGKVYSLKCRFCEEVFHGPLSVQEDWVRHLQKHILKLGYRGKASPPPTPVTAPTLVGPVAM